MEEVERGWFQGTDWPEKSCRTATLRCLEAGSKILDLRGERREEKLREERAKWAVKNE